MKAVSFVYHMVSGNETQHTKRLLRWQWRRPRNWNLSPRHHSNPSTFWRSIHSFSAISSVSSHVRGSHNKAIGHTSVPTNLLLRNLMPWDSLVIYNLDDGDDGLLHRATVQLVQWWWPHSRPRSLSDPFTGQCHSFSCYHFWRIHTQKRGYSTTPTPNKQKMSGSGSRTAILLLDFQNEFVKKGGKLHNDVADTMEKTGVLENVPKLVDFARKTDAMIIYSPVVMKESGTLTSSVARRQSTTFHSTEYSKQYGLFTENTWNCEIIHEVEPRNDDIILRDRSDFSAFEGTKLISELRDNNITHFFIM